MRKRFSPNIDRQRVGGLRSGISSISRFCAVQPAAIRPKGTVGLGFVLLLCGCMQLPTGELMVQGMAQRADDRVAVDYEPGAVVFLVTSPSGIGGATFTLLQGRWPAEVRVRLRYAEGRGFATLENFTCAIGRKAPVPIQATAVLPQYIEVRLPAKWLASDTRSVQVSWVDYYR